MRVITIAAVGMEVIFRIYYKCCSVVVVYTFLMVTVSVYTIDCLVFQLIIWSIENFGGCIVFHGLQI